MRHEPLPTIQKLIKECYPDAKAVFWAGSVSVNQGTSASDLDLVIVFEEVAHAYREAFIYDGWPIDAFIHDLDTLRYFCGRLEASDGKPALIHMILHGQEILAQNSVSMEAKAIAAEALANGPDTWNQAQIDKERFLITDILDDIKSPKNKEEQIISAVHLFEPLLQFYFRAARKWTSSGKSLIRVLKQENPELAEEWTTAFESLVKTGDASGIESAVTKILAPHGGYLWDGFRSDAPADWKECDENKILDELKIREPIFHHSSPTKVSKGYENTLQVYGSDELQNLTHRKAIVTDLPHIIALLLEDELGQTRESKSSELDGGYIKAFHKIDSDPNQYLMVVENENEIIGTCHLTIMPSLTFIGSTRMQIEAVRVAGRYRGQKIGSWMFDQAISYAKENDVSIVQLTTNKKRPKAKHFYENLGFEASHEGMKLYLRKTL